MQQQGSSNGYGSNADHPKDKERKWFILKRVSFILSRVFNSIKKTLPESHGDHEVQRNDEYGDHSTICIRSDQIRSGDKKSHSFKKLSEIGSEGRNKNRKPMSLSLSRFFHRNSCSSFKWMRGKINKIDINSNLSTSASFNSNRSTSFNINGQNSSTSTERIAEIMIGRQGSTRSLSRVPSRILTTSQKLKMAHSLTKMGSRRKSWREDGDEWQSLISMGSRRETEKEMGCGVELCKKRILLGGKCKPLNNSGTLQYDKDGVLLPDIIP